MEILQEHLSPVSLSRPGRMGNINQGSPEKQSDSEGWEPEALRAGLSAHLVRQRD